MAATGRTVALRLEPYESRFLVFSDSAPRAAATGCANRANGAGRRVHRADDGLDGVVHAERRRHVQASGGCTEGGRGRARPLDRLRSWTDDEATRYFSGTATYEIRVTRAGGAAAARAARDAGVRRRHAGQPAGARIPRRPRPRRRPCGSGRGSNPPVREAAVVYVNDKRAGAVWAPPYAVDVTAFLTPGDNRIRIVVGNTTINHMAGRPLPSYRLLNLRYGERFTPQDMKDLQPLPSGICCGRAPGPRRLVTSHSLRASVNRRSRVNRGSSRRLSRREDGHGTVAGRAVRASVSCGGRRDSRRRRCSRSDSASGRRRRFSACWMRWCCGRCRTRSRSGW